MNSYFKNFGRKLSDSEELDYYNEYPNGCFVLVGNIRNTRRSRYPLIRMMLSKTKLGLMVTLDPCSIPAKSNLIKGYILNDRVSIPSNGEEYLNIKMSSREIEGIREICEDNNIPFFFYDSNADNINQDKLYSWVAQTIF